MTTAPTIIRPTPEDQARTLSMLLHVARRDYNGQHQFLAQIADDDRVVHIISCLISIIFDARPQIVTSKDEQQLIERSIARLYAKHEQQQLDDVAADDNSDDDSSDDDSSNKC